jgi:hypothetical protein
MFGKDSQGVIRRWTSAPSQEVREAVVDVAAEELASARPYADPPRYAVSSFAPSRGAWDDGEKFPGGFGPTLLLTTDYWTLRARSAQLFETNIYGRGVIRRLLTNELNTGLHLECTPVESVLGKEEDSLADWSEDVESRFLLWAKDPYLCDYYQRSTFGALQVQLRRESLLDDERSSSCGRTSGRSCRGSKSSGERPSRTR